MENDQLSCPGMDWEKMPRWVAERYGPQAHRVDLSYNNLCSLDNLELFTQCHELILDNNSVSDDVIFPQMTQLTTLSLNKNKIIDTEGFLKKVKDCFPNITFLS